MAEFYYFNGVHLHSEEQISVFQANQPPGISLVRACSPEFSEKRKKRLLSYNLECFLTSCSNGKLANTN